MSYERPKNCPCKSPGKRERWKSMGRKKCNRCGTPLKEVVVYEEPFEPAKGPEIPEVIPAVLHFGVSDHETM